MALQTFFFMNNMGFSLLHLKHTLGTRSGTKSTPGTESGVY
jgi:hypothetical protein